jgi:hypothetical protein
MHAHELVKKARRAKIPTDGKRNGRVSKTALARQLFDIAEAAQRKGWNAEALLRAENKRRERALRRRENQKTA